MSIGQDVDAYLLIDVRIAVFYGLPPPMSTQQQMRSIDKALSPIPGSIPSWFGALLAILKVTSSAMDNLGGVEDPTLHFSLSQVFEDQLYGLKRANADLWRSELEIEWCNARLCLYALDFTISASTNPSHVFQIQARRQAILYKALEAASNLTAEMRKLGQQCTSDLWPSGRLTFVPKSYFTALFNATTFLFRFIATCHASVGTPMQGSLAMGSIIEAHKIFQSFPEQRELTRAAIHIEMFIDVSRDSAAISMDELVVNNKLGASVMFDAVFRACRQRNIDPRTGKPLAVQEWKTVSETFTQRLPDAPARAIGDGDGKIKSVASYENNDFDVVEQSSALDRQNQQWWGDWENHMDLFQVGVEQWEFEDMEQSMGDHNNLSELGDFMYA